MTQSLIQYHCYVTRDTAQRLTAWRNCVHIRS